MKIGVSITTYNAENYLQDLYNSLPRDKIDELVIVNGGNPYQHHYDCEWIQHTENLYAARARNDGLNYLISKNIDYYFLIEDDMVIKSPDVFEKYIDACKQSNLHYFAFPSTSYYSGKPHARTPKLEIQYSPTCSISFFPHMCNDFVFMSKELLNALNYKLYITEGAHKITGFDVELAYRISKTGLASKFWWFADITGSDNYVENNPQTISRVLNKPNYDNIKRDFFKEFYNIHGINITEIPDTSKDQFIKFIKQRIQNES